MDSLSLSRRITSDIRDHVVDDLDGEYRDAVVLNEHGVQGIGIRLPRDFRQAQELKRMIGLKAQWKLIVSVIKLADFKSAY